MELQKCLVQSGDIENHTNPLTDTFITPLIQITTHFVPFSFVPVGIPGNLGDGSFIDELQSCKTL